MRKETKITPGSNLIWESSRMFLPEHKEAYLEYRRQQLVQERPEHDEQAWEEMLRVLQESKERGRLIAIVVYGEYSHSSISGVVERMERERGVQIAGQWITWSDIIGVDGSGE